MMAQADVNLQLAAIYFLKQLDEEGGYSRYYKKELASRYRQFCRRNPRLDKYAYGAMLGYLRKKKFVYMTKGQVIKKPLFISVEANQHLVFTVNPGHESRTEFYVCQVCDRGFPSQNGLGTHIVSDSHIQQLNNLCQSIGNNFICPKLECNFRASNFEGIVWHFQNDKSIKVTRDPNSNEIRTRQDREQKYYCKTCCVRCNSEFSFKQHQAGQRHAMNLFREVYRTNRHHLIQDKGRLEVRFQVQGDGDPGAVLSVNGGQNVDNSVTLQIRNNGPRVTFVSFFHFLFHNPKNVTLSDARNVSAGAAHHIKSQGSYEVKVIIRPTSFGQMKIPILLIFKRGTEELKILREILFNCVANPQVFEEIQPIAPYKKPEKKEASNFRVIPSNYRPSANKKIALEIIHKLKDYKIPDYILEAIQAVADASDEIEAEEIWLQKKHELGLTHLQPSGYSNYFDILLHVEEHQMQHDILQYSMEDVPMRKEAKSNLVVIDNIPGLAENRPSVLTGDSILVTRNPEEGVSFEGRVDSVHNTSIKLGFDESFMKGFVDKMKFKVEFTINRFSIKHEHRAVSLQMMSRIQHLIFPSAMSVPAPLAIKQMRFFNRQVESNYEQNTAVRHVVAGTSQPSPYLIYGPPGTGKTFTLVEAIKQVYTQYPNCRILACAPQNAAADLIAKRLMDHVDKRDILRLNAPSRSYGDVLAEIQKISNYSSKSEGGPGVVGRQMLGGTSGSANMQVEFPVSDILKQRKVLVSTLVTSGRLVSADMVNHFTHIFIDEAGHATEPETVIPLSGLISSARSNVQIVLAGDPKQLGPVVRSPLATPLGISLLERLMSCDIYQRDARSGHFNQNYVTKLVRSFRSHPDILEVPNSCFYDNELQACADELQRQRFCNWEGLPTKGFPLIFHGVNGREEREARSPSFFNPDEVMQVIEYVRLLMECKSPRVRPEDIGIISPYNQQVNKIVRGLQALERSTPGRTRNYANIKVGSVEKFQGDEREVIIISTVRSQDFYLTHDKDFNLGFVGNPKRFNVAISRAKALLIIVGNPSILRRDKNWQKLINHIEEGGGCTGHSPPDEIEEDIEDLTLLTQSMTIKEALSQGASDHIQQGDQEWNRKE